MFFLCEDFTAQRERFRFCFSKLNKKFRKQPNAQAVLIALERNWLPAHSNFPKIGPDTNHVQS